METQAPLPPPTHALPTPGDPMLNHLAAFIGFIDIFEDSLRTTTQPETAVHWHQRHQQTTAGRSKDLSLSGQADAARRQGFFLGGEGTKSTQTVGGDYGGWYSAHGGDNPWHELVVAHRGGPSRQVRVGTFTVDCTLPEEPDRGPA